MTQTPKYTVRVVKVGKLFAIEVSNRAGRTWRNKDLEGCPGNAGEAAMCLEEWLATGGKLQNPDNWVQTNPGRAAERYINEMAAGTRQGPRDRLRTRAARRGAAA